MKIFVQRWNFLKHFSLSLVISLCFFLGIVNIIAHLKMIGITNRDNGSITILSKTADGPTAIFISSTPPPFMIFVVSTLILIFLLILYVPIKKDLPNK